MSAKIHRKDEDKSSKGAFAEPLLEKQEGESSVSEKAGGGGGMDLQIINHKRKSISEISGSEELVCLNLRGKKFFVLLRNFASQPNTRLAKMIRCSEVAEIETFCDKYTEGDVPEFFFDRSGKGFNDILDIYRGGSFHINTAGMCALQLKKEMGYWGIDELLLDPCCALKYYPEVEICQKEIQGQASSESKYLERIQDENFGGSQLGKIRKTLWNLTEYPETSIPARVVAFTSIAVVLISTVTFVLSTLPELTDNIDMVLFNETADESAPVIRWENGILALKVVDNFTMVFFTVEYIVRFMCAPKKWTFFKAPLNIIDLLAILPYFFGFIVEGIKDTQVIGRAGKVLRLIRVMRILRIFKLVRHFAGLQSLLSTLQQAYKELGLLMILVWVSVLTCSSLVYFAEKDAEARWSFMDSFWWGLMVLTTVGYGSTAPSTVAGKMIGGFCALLGVFILALPVPIVVNSFSTNYKNRLWRNEVMAKKEVQIDEDEAKRSAEKKSNGYVGRKA